VCVFFPSGIRYSPTAVNFIVISNKFWEEQMAYFPSLYFVSRKKTSGFVRNEANKSVRFGKLQYWYY
jgi:hypothetical protein